MQDFKKLIVWQKAHGLVLEIYKASSDFPKHEIYGITSQIRRSASSIAANIAEGSGKYSTEDVNRYFQIALGSAKETEYFLILAKDLYYISETLFTDLDNKLSEVRAILITLIKNNRLNEDQAYYSGSNI